MNEQRCPGQDQRYWSPEDIFDVPCPACGTEIEFWKDEPVRYCPGCQTAVCNPKMDKGCTEWCKYGKKCIG